MGYVERHLLPNERLLDKTRLHWILFFRPGLVLLAGIVLAALLAQVPQPPWLWYVGGIVIVAGVSWMLIRFIELMTSEFAVTTTRLIFKVGLIAANVGIDRHLSPSPPPPSGPPPGASRSASRA